MSVRLADLALADLVVPDDAETLPASGVDAGVVPEDMADHLRVALVFPVAPTVTGGALPLQVVGGGRCVWAAARASWPRPIRCVLQGPAPPNLETISLAQAQQEEVIAPRLVHSAAFERLLPPGKRAQVEEHLRLLADRMRARRIKGFSTIADLHWAREDLLHLSVPSGPPNAPVLGRELYATFATLAARGIPLRAWDGRVLL